MNTQRKIEIIKSWAAKHYSKSYGASCLVECFTDTELAAEFEKPSDARKWALLQDEMQSNTFAQDEQPISDVIAEMQATPFNWNTTPYVKSESEMEYELETGWDFNEGEKNEYIPMPHDTAPGCYQRSCENYAMFGSRYDEYYNTGGY